MGQMSSFKIHSELLLQHLDYSCCFTLIACSEMVLDVDYGVPSQGDWKVGHGHAFQNPSKEDYYGELGDEKGQNSQTFPENISSWKSDKFPTKSTQFPKVRKTTHPLVHY